MYMYILCFRQMFSTEQVPAGSHKKWFYAYSIQIYVWYGCLLYLYNRDFSEKFKCERKYKTQEGDKFY